MLLRRWLSGIYLIPALLLFSLRSIQGQFLVGLSSWLLDSLNQQNKLNVFPDTPKVAVNVSSQETVLLPTLNSKHRITKQPATLKTKQSTTQVTTTTSTPELIDTSPTIDAGSFVQAPVAQAKGLFLPVSETQASQKVGPTMSAPAATAEASLAVERTDLSEHMQNILRKLGFKKLLTPTAASLTSVNTTPFESTQEAAETTKVIENKLREELSALALSTAAKHRSKTTPTTTLAEITLTTPAIENDEVDSSSAATPPVADSALENTNVPKESNVQKILRKMGYLKGLNSPLEPGSLGVVAGSESLSQTDAISRLTLIPGSSGRSELPENHSPGWQPVPGSSNGNTELAPAIEQRFVNNARSSFGSPGSQSPVISTSIDDNVESSPEFALLVLPTIPSKPDSSQPAAKSRSGNANENESEEEQAKIQEKAKALLTENRESSSSNAKDRLKTVTSEEIARRKIDMHQSIPSASSNAEDYSSEEQTISTVYPIDRINPQIASSLLSGRINSPNAIVQPLQFKLPAFTPVESRQDPSNFNTANDSTTITSEDAGLEFATSEQQQQQPLPVLTNPRQSPEQSWAQPQPIQANQQFGPVSSGQNFQPWPPASQSSTAFSAGASSQFPSSVFSSNSFFPSSPLTGQRVRPPLYPTSYPFGIAANGKTISAETYSQLLPVIRQQQQEQRERAAAIDYQQRLSNYANSQARAQSEATGSRNAWNFGTDRNAAVVQPNQQSYVTTPTTTIRRAQDADFAQLAQFVVPTTSGAGETFSQSLQGAPSDQSASDKAWVVPYTRNVPVSQSPQQQNNGVQTSRTKIT